MENSTSLPSLYKLATLSQIYGVTYEQLLRIYGVTLSAGSLALKRGGNGRELATPAPVWA